MAFKHWIAGALAGAALVTLNVDAQRSQPAPTSPRIYIFDNGAIRGLDPALFNFKREELREVDFVNVSYLIVHPRGTLMFDAGAVADSHFKADGSPVTEGIMSATKPLLPQLAAAGYAAPRHHLLRAVAFPLRPHGQCERVCERDLDRAEGRARLHVRG